MSNNKDDEKCVYCGWCPKSGICHVEYSLNDNRFSNCEYIKEKYIIFMHDDNGETDYFEKPKCYICNKNIMLNKNYKIDKRVCCNFDNNYYHKYCYKKSLTNKTTL